MKEQNHWINNSNATNTANRVTIVLFIIYFIVMCWILLFKLGVQFSYMENRNVNLIPFRQQLASKGAFDLGQIILNGVIFVPFGIYVGILFRSWPFGKKLAFILFSSLVVESLQFILAIGAFDTTDLVTNTFGGIVGLLLWKIIEKVSKNTAMAQTVINTIAAIGTGLAILFLLFLKLNMLPVRYQ